MAEENTNPVTPAPAAPARSSGGPQSEETSQFTRGPRGGGGGGRGRGRRSGGDSGQNREGGDSDLVEKVVFINRSSKVVKGGRRFNFSALIVVGDKKGRVGMAMGKASEVADAIRRGGELARSQMVPVSLKDATIPHEVFSRYGGAKILLRPASPGTGIIAGKTARAVLESAGVKDVLTKSLGSSNAANVVKATLNGLLSLRLREDIYSSRGMVLKKFQAPAATPVPAVAETPAPAPAQPETPATPA